MKVGDTVKTLKGRTATVKKISEYKGKTDAMLEFENGSFAFYTLRKNGKYTHQPRYGKGLKDEILG